MTVKSPLEMARWLTRREEALRLRGEDRKTAERLSEVHTAVKSARTLLEKAAQLLGLQEPAQELVDLDHQLRQALSQAQASATEKSAALFAVKGARETFQRTKIALERATIADAKWLADWQSAVVEIQLAPTSGTAEAEAALGAWEAVTAPLTKRNEDRRDEGMNANLERFRADVNAIAAELGETIQADAPVEKIVRELKTRLDTGKVTFKTAPIFRGALWAFRCPWTMLGNNIERQLLLSRACGRPTDSGPRLMPTIWRAARCSVVASAI